MSGAQDDPPVTPKHIGSTFAEVDTLPRTLAKSDLETSHENSGKAEAATDGGVFLEGCQSADTGVETESREESVAGVFAHRADVDSSPLPQLGGLLLSAGWKNSRRVAHRFMAENVWGIEYIAHFILVTSHHSDGSAQDYSAVRNERHEETQHSA